MDDSSAEFDRYADSYEDALKGSVPAALFEDKYFAQYKVDHVVDRLAGRSPKALLDFGCGIGRSLSMLHERFPQASLYGYDPSSQSIDLARKHMTQARLTTDLATLPRSGFDLVFMANVLHHIPPDLQPDVLSRCRDLLGDDGRLFIFEHNPLNIATRIIFERCPFDRDATMLRRSRTTALVKAAGLRVVSAEYTLFFPRPLSFLRPVERVLGWLPLGAQYCLQLGR